MQVFTNVNGAPLTSPEFLPLFDLIAEYDRPMWLHPARGSDFADYRTETSSKFEIWWTFGWPYETSVTMARIVFAGVFDRHPGLKIITHHMGGMIRYHAEENPTYGYKRIQGALKNLGQGTAPLACPCWS